MEENEGLLTSRGTFNSRVILRSQFVFINHLLATQQHCGPTKIVLVLIQFKRIANIHMKLINELLELMMLITYKISKEPPSNVGKEHQLQPQDVASNSSSATVSMTGLAKSLSLSSYRMISLGKKNDVLSQAVKSGMSFSSGTWGY